MKNKDSLFMKEYDRQFRDTNTRKTYKVRHMPLNHLATHLFTEIEIELLNRFWANLKCPIKLSEPSAKKSASISSEKKENRITMHKHADHCQIQ